MSIPPETAEVIEVSPRDGIQNELVLLSLDTKLALITRAIAAGARRLEVTSFVNPARVPQMADAAELAAMLPQGPARYIGLALNAKGFQRALDANLHEVNFVLVATDSFSIRNQGITTAEAIALWSDLGTHPKARLTIGAAFGCPFEGEVPLAKLLHIVERAMHTNPPELALADTIGVATPRDISERVTAIRRDYPQTKIRLHLHNTRNTGIANAWAGLLAGATAFDAAMGGTGGCPFAPKATGNIATEDLIYLLHRAHIQTGYDLDACIETALWLESQLGHQIPGMVMKAGPFPANPAAVGAP